MTEIRNSQKYDLEERTYQFAKRCRLFVNKLPRTISNIEDGKQLIRSSGSIGSNYREANESLSKKDFVMRAKICRKEAKETVYWLMLIVEVNDTKLNSDGNILVREADELKKIFSSIIEKSK